MEWVGFVGIDGEAARDGGMSPFWIDGWVGEKYIVGWLAW